MAGLDEHIIASETVLLHVEGDIFGRGDSTSSPESGSVLLVESPVISIARLYIEKQKNCVCYQVEGGQGQS